MVQGVLNHLWQSTLFAGVVGLLTWVFRDYRAQVRASRRVSSRSCNSSWTTSAHGSTPTRALPERVTTESVDPAGAYFQRLQADR
jgi:hypothetical protein